MCGIAGFYNLSDQNLLDNMVQSILHRGPDGHGAHVIDKVGLGHCRLTIIDLTETGDQPMVTEDGRYTMIYNGEVYNYKELRADLEKKGITFRSTGDTEVVLKLFILEGPEAFSKLNGMFACAIYDKQEKSLVLARDRFGIKPLYLYEAGDRLYFASEIKAFHEIDGFDPALSLDALQYYMRFQYVPAPLTMYRNVRKLPQGHFLKLGGGERTSGSYLPKPQEQEELRLSDAEAVSNTEKLLRASVVKHMIADVPVGLFLSGGIDSSLLAAMVSRDFGTVDSFSVVFDGDREFDEGPFSRQIAKSFNLNHTEIPFGDQVPEELLFDMARQLDEPLADPATIPTYVLSRETARHIKVVLTGEGADEIFGGYKQYLLDPLFATPAGSLMVALLGLHPKLKNSTNRRKLEKVAAAVSRAQRRQEYTSIFSTGMLKKVMPGALNDANANYLGSNGDLETLNRWLDFDLTHWLPDDLLMKADKMTMRFSLEGRVPYLENDLSDYVSRLPARMKVRGMTSKWIQKQVAVRYLPRDLVFRRKHGFNLPLKHWFRNEQASFLKKQLDALEPYGIFDMGQLRSLYDAHQNGRDYERELYTLMILSLWLTQDVHKGSTFEREMAGA